MNKAGTALGTDHTILTTPHETKHIQSNICTMTVLFHLISSSMTMRVDTLNFVATTKKSPFLLMYRKLTFPLL